MQLPVLSLSLPKSVASDVSRPRHSWRRWGLRGLVLGLAVVLILEVVRVLFGGNIHEVVPGRLYRSAQLPPNQLRDLIQKRGIKTIVNLRGCCATFDWYRNECKVAHDMNVAIEDITLSANRLPAPSEIRQLIEVLDRAEYPIVMHCRQGADRTGLAAAVYLLLHTDADYAKARGQCSVRYAHVPILSTVNMDRFFDKYEAWLHQCGRAHAPEFFRKWALTEYRPGPAPARLERIDPVPVLHIGEAYTVRVRATNLSNEVWEFKTGGITGIHIRASVSQPNGRPSTYLRAARLEARVAPGQSIELAVPLQPFHEPGMYDVIIDLGDRNLDFCQLGSEWLQFEIKVEDNYGR